MRSTARTHRRTSLPSACTRRLQNWTHEDCGPTPRTHCRRILQMMCLSGWTLSNGTNTTKVGTVGRLKISAANWTRSIRLSPINRLLFQNMDTALAHQTALRATLAASKSCGNKVGGTLYGYGNIPVEECEAALPAVKPGGSISVSLQFKEPSASRVEFNILRPTGFSARTRTWTP